MTREISLPSGAVLKVSPAPFADANALFKAVLAELGAVKVESGADVPALVLKAACAGFSSPKIEAALWKCMERCLYCGPAGEMKIDRDTFEPVDARQDYMAVSAEVVKENVGPFTKSLFAEYKHVLSMIDVTQPSKA